MRRNRGFVCFARTNPSYVAVQHIVYVTADGDGVKIGLVNGETVTVSEITVEAAMAYIGVNR